MHKPDSCGTLQTPCLHRATASDVFQNKCKYYSEYQIELEICARTNCLGADVFWHGCVLIVSSCGGVLIVFKCGCVLTRVCFDSFQGLSWPAGEF